MNGDQFTFTNIKGTYFDTLEEASAALTECMKTANTASVQLTDPSIKGGIIIKVENGAGWMVSYVTRHGFVRYLHVSPLTPPPPPAT